MSERITYAQKKFRDLLEQSKFKSWCSENNSPYELLHKIAIGERVPTYKLMCQTCDIIPPAEWLYFTDEKIPYKVQTVPKWDVEQESFFIKAHKADYKEICKKYNLEQIDGYNLFCMKRLRPSMVIIRKFIKDIDPILFFIGTKEVTTILEYPEAGEIITAQNKQYFCVSKKSFNEEKQKIIVAPVINQNIQTDTLITLNLKDVCILTENQYQLDAEQKQEVLTKIKNNLF
ncbi:MAG: hypothetical protein MJ179_00970 [Treponema sp.]|nr:hypothetical protein [Treponema sp.]